MDFGFNFISPCDSVTEKTIEFLAVDMTPSVFVREREGGREEEILTGCLFLLLLFCFIKLPNKTECTERKHNADGHL